MSDLAFLFNAAAISVVVLVIGAVNRQRPERLWLIIHTAIIAAAVAVYVLQVPGAGAVLFGLSMLLVIAPSVLRQIGYRLENDGSIRPAASCLFFAALLHPSADWRFDAARSAALARPTRAGQAGALKILASRSTPEQAFELLLLRLRILNDWDGILRVPLPAGRGQTVHPLLLLLKIRALGETGYLNQMVDLYLRTRPLLEHTGALAQVLPAVLVLTGRVQALDALLATASTQAALKPPERHWMVQLARLAAGRPEARQTLQRLVNDEEDPEQRALMQKRLDRPLADPATDLRPELAARLDAEVENLMRHRAATRPAQATIPVTVTLIIANLAAYGYELSLGDPMLQRTLIIAGGMWPPDILVMGQWWRLASSLFLHAGWLHLGFNMAALYVIGRVVERRFGSQQTAVLYLAGGICSSLLVLWLMLASLAGLNVLVGASGAIFSLVGALIVQIVTDWRRTRALQYRAALNSMVVLLVLQFFADTVIPEVSFSAHIGGLVAGAALGAIFILFRR